MNNTQPGVNPSGYSGSGYGMARNRLLTQTPAVPDQPVHQVVFNPGGPDVPYSPYPGINPGGPDVVAGPVPWWKTLGHPQWHGTTFHEPPVGILGFTFGSTPSGWKVK